MTDNKELFEFIRDALAKKTGLESRERQLWDRFGDRCAVLVLDSTGFTRVAMDRGIVHFLACLVRLRDVVEPIFKRFGCLSYRADADNIYAAFETPDEALEAAIEANESVMAEKIMLTDSEPFQICIGIGYGEVLRSEAEGVFGDEMNLASKLGEDVAQGGQILLTESAYADVDRKQRERFRQRRTSISGVSITYYWTTCSAYQGRK